MKISPLSIITLLGVSQAEMPRIKLTPKDKQMLSWPMYTPYDGCYKEPTDTFGEFKKTIRKGQLYGPCHYIMYRNYEGDVAHHLQKKDKTSKFTSFVINLQAPKQMTTRITGINFGRGELGSDCSSFRFSRVTKDDKEKPRYFETIAENDRTPRYSIRNLNYIEGGDYLVELPSTCLTDGSLSVLTAHMYEDVATQLQLIGGSGKLYKNSTQCDLPNDKTPIKAHKKYMKLAKSLNPDCQYNYEREYRWVVPATHLLNEDGTTSVMAQIQLNEPMIADATRMITKLSLETVSGASCRKAALYTRDELPHKGKDHPIKPLKNKSGILQAKLPWGELSNTSHDFLFVLPKDCKIMNPVLRMRVVDSNMEPSKQAQAQPGKLRRSSSQ